MKKNGKDYFFKCGYNHLDYDERCEYVNWDASCLETPPMTVKAPFKMQRDRFT